MCADLVLMDLATPGTLPARLGAHSRTRAVLKAQRLGLVPYPGEEVGGSPG